MLGFLQKIKHWLMLGEDTILPEVESRILVGKGSAETALKIFEANLLLTYPIQLAPAHVDCVRIIFARGVGALSIIFEMANSNQVGVIYDSILTYGTQGIPLIPSPSDKKE